jgi:cell division protein ZapA (FtsZ GTPase activity inhibitor)
MEEKRKIEVDIAGLKMTLVTDEPEAFVDSVVRHMNESMTALLSSGKNRSRLDAAMLCAMDFCSDKLTAEKRVRNLEAQISLYDVNLRKARNENAELREAVDGPKEKTPKEKAVTSEQIKITDEIPGEKDAKNDAHASESREDKFRMIESLLRKKGDK